MKNYENLLSQGKTFEQNKTTADRKDKGVFYTPLEIVQYISQILQKIDLIKNPYIKILDPACGAGYFLLSAFDILRQKFEADFDTILQNHKELQSKITRQTIGKFIAENNIWGADIDPGAVQLAQSAIQTVAGIHCNPNIYCCDSLIDGDEEAFTLFEDAPKASPLWQNKYDYIIGNPPYIGHKGVSADYKKKLQQIYKGIYKDKSDISYCFIQRAIESLREGGLLSFITSRYFMEGPSAAGLRKYIRENATLLQIVDFFGYKVFEEAGVAACIITVKKGIYEGDTEILRFKTDKKALKDTPIMKVEHFDRCSIPQSHCKDEGWLLISPEKYDIFEAVESQGTHTLEEIFQSHQGIITGCDRAFVVDESLVEIYGIEKELLRPWIKNSHVEKFYIKPTDKYIIYADFIQNESDYPNAIGFIRQYQEKLLERRECKKGVRKWYELQWGRKSETFEARKLIYPYKSGTSRFAIDDRGRYCSADVYSLILRDTWQEKLTMEYVTALLNAKLFEFYFKCFAKKISHNLYDYYPNTVLRIKINAEKINFILEEQVKSLQLCENEKKRSDILGDIDKIIYDMYGITTKQAKLIEEELYK